MGQQAVRTVPAGTPSASDQSSHVLCPVTTAQLPARIRHTLPRHATRSLSASHDSSGCRAALSPICGYRLRFSFPACSAHSTPVCGLATRVFFSDSPLRRYCHSTDTGHSEALCYPPTQPAPLLPPLKQFPRYLQNETGGLTSRVESRPPRGETRLTGQPKSPPMYEYHLTALPNGVTDVNIDVDTTEYRDPRNSDESNPNAHAVSVRVEFAVMTDTIAWITIDGNGLISPAFGGTGRSHEEVDEYTEQAVAIWRAVIGDYDTVCRYRDDDATDTADEPVFTPTR